MKIKQKDLAVIIAVVAISAIISVFVSSKIFASPKQRSQQVEVVPAISSSFPSPSTSEFNSQSIDPTVTIQIGTSSNSSPFNGSN